jgi:copper/silver efflux system protein
VASVAADFGAVMLLYLKHGIEAHMTPGNPITGPQIEDGTRRRCRAAGATQSRDRRGHHRGLLPIFWGHGTGSEIMSRIAAPMVGGMITAPLLSLFVIPAAYRLIRLRRVRSQGMGEPGSDSSQYEAP